MSAPVEVVLSADSAGQLFNCAVFDPHSGSEFLSYRGGNTSSRSLTVLNGEYILGAQLGKNFINVWEIQRKMSTGNLLAILSRHYQDVSCIRFTDDSSHFVSGGKDNLALIWNLSSVVQLDSSRTPEPCHILSRHSLPITDIHCGLMGPQARVATASLDQTVKVWEVSSGEMLLSVLFDVAIMSVTFDPCEYFLFCGGSDGNIFQVSLCSTSLSRDKTFQTDSDGNQVFKGHRNLVTCLSVSMDGTLLLSVHNHKGPVTNAVIIPAPANMFLADSHPAVPLPRFSRHLNPSEQGDGTGSGGMCLKLRANTQEPEGTYLEKADELYSLMCAVTDKSVFGDGENTKVRVSELEEEVKTLKKINKDLYEFSTQLLTKPN
ncbi:LOW QUALITY PROTEIN: WD repeat-containing protein 18 [Sinocyclocheilus anshuiensis]|uniref:LOW QUALITY PROTEIN: WD repeat-containing protein 18 n=1 Tax=Sinocyclocheilus anshuiensis TaxID=1608454 RepID=UPI003D697E35